MKPVNYLLAVVLAIVILAASQVMAQPMPGPMGHGYGPCGQFHQGPMGHGPCSGQGPALKTLTPEQRAKYYAIKQEFAPKFQNLRDQLFVKKNVLKALTNSNQTDLGKVEALSQEIVKLQAAKRELHKAMAERLEKECGLKKPMPPIPGVDFLPSGPHHGPFHGPHHGPHHGPMF